MKPKQTLSTSIRAALMASSALIALGSGAVAAPQSGGQNPTGGGTGGAAAKKKPETEFELPPYMKEESETKGATPDGLVARLKRDLGRFPGTVGKRAIAEVVANGQAVIPPLRALLEGFEFPPRIGAAIALAQLNDVPSAPRIAALLDDKRSVAQAPALLDVIYRLSPDEGDRVALEKANARDRDLRAASLTALGQHLRPELTPGLRSLLESEHEKTRLEAFTLLEALTAPGLEVEAMRLLGDNSPQVNVVAKNWLAKHKNDAIVSELLSLAHEDPPGRESLWALLTVAEIEERYGVALFHEEIIPLLTPRLRSLDKLVRLSAAIALAHAAARSTAADAETLLASSVVPTFMETYLSGDYFKDALPLLDMSATRLSRLTGIELGTDLTRWREAWLGGGSTPRIRRDLDPKSILDAPATLVVRYRRSGAEDLGLDRDLAFISDAAIGSPPPEADSAIEWLYVPQARLAELASAIVDRNVLSGRAVAPERLATPGYRTVRVTLQNRERAAAIPAAPRGTDADFESIETSILDLADQLAWQRLYVGPSAQFPDWYATQSKELAACADSSARATRFVSSFGLAASGLDSRVRCQFLSILLRDPDASPLRIEDIQVLISTLADESVVEGPWMVLGALVVKRGSDDALGLLIDQTAAKFGTDSIPLISEWIEERNRAAAALLSASPVVRMAALHAAERHPGLLDPAQLTGALGDADARTRRAAVFALAVHPEAVARAEVMKIASDRNAPLVRVALEACGSMPNEEVKDVLAAAAVDPDEAIATAAMRAYARMPLGTGVPLLAALAEAPTAEPGRKSAAFEAIASIASTPALGAFGISTVGAASAATETLRRALASVSGPQQIEIAYLAAARLDVQAAPVLLRVLESDPQAERARDALEMLFCTDGGERGEMFTQRWNQNPERSADDWFAGALASQGLKSGGMLTTQTLLDACRDDRWFVRHGAIVRLAARLGAAISSPGRFAKQEQIEKVARRLEGIVVARACGA